MSTTAVLRPAATIVILRPSSNGLDREVLLVRRHQAIGFFGGAYAFPGGRVEASDVPAQSAATDASTLWQGHDTPPVGLDWTEGDHARLYAAYATAAVREAKEEANLDLKTTDLRPWARWITPLGEPKRYDTLFFVAAPPQQGEVAVDGDEITNHRWLSPEAALAAHDRAEIFLPPPTAITLGEMVGMSLTNILATKRFPRREVLPLLRQKGDDWLLLFPGDPEHPLPRPSGWPDARPTRMTFPGRKPGTQA